MALGYQVNRSFFEGPAESSFTQHFPKNNIFNTAEFENCVNAYMAYQKAWDCDRQREKETFIKQAKENISKIQNPDATTAAQAKQDLYNILCTAAKALTSYWFGVETRGSKMMATFRDAFAVTYPEVAQSKTHATKTTRVFF